MADDESRLDNPYNVAPKGGAGSSDGATFKDFQNEADENHIKRAYPWMDEEYAKHLEGLRARYPMLTEYLMRQPARDNANLSNIQTTNKYARLADAYNAKLRYAPTGGNIGSALGGNVAPTDAYEPVPQLNTQDQKQMETFRQMQAELGQHKLGEESFFSRDIWRRKADEMAKLVDESYLRQFWNSTEQRRRIAAQFDKWQNMNETEFAEVMRQLKIPEAKRKQLMELLRNNDYLGYGHEMAAYGYQPFAIEQIYQYSTTGDVLGQLVRGETDYKTAAKELSKFGAQYIIQSIYGYVKEAESSGDPTLMKVAQAVRSATSSVADVGVNATDLLERILQALGGKEVGGTSLLGYLSKSLFGVLTPTLVSR
jgi:hypothetical protein